MTAYPIDDIATTEVTITELGVDAAPYLHNEGAAGGVGRQWLQPHSMTLTAASGQWVVYVVQGPPGLMQDGQPVATSPNVSGGRRINRESATGIVGIDYVEWSGGGTVTHVIRAVLSRSYRPGWDEGPYGPAGTVIGLGVLRRPGGNSFVVDADIPTSGGVGLIGVTDPARHSFYWGEPLFAGAEPVDTWPPSPPEPEPEPIPTSGPRLDLGPVGDPIEITGDAFTITARRGGTPDLPTTSLESGWMRATITDATVRPDTHPAARTGRPIRLMLTQPDPEDPEATLTLPIAAGTLDKAVIQYPDKGETGTRVVLEAVDVLGTAGATPHDTPVHAGGFAHRVAEVLDPHGLPHTITDTSGSGPSATVLPSTATTVLDHLRLIRDTTHGVIATTRDGRIAAYADRDRPTRDETPVFTLTDRPIPASPTVIHYTHIDPDFDTSNVLNVLDVTVAGDSDTQTFIDHDSVTEWGPSTGSVTVTDGRPGHHAARYMAERDEPVLTAKRIVYSAAADPRQAYTPDLGMVCRIHRDGLLDVLHEVTAIEHTIAATVRGGGQIKWTVALELRPLSRSPIRWRDVPPALTWTDAPPALTWTDAASWRP